MHEESLRRILASTVDLTGDQQREIVGHLEDSIDAKMANGMNEMEAVAQAFEEIGDLKQISREFRAPRNGVANVFACYVSLLILVGVNVSLTPVIMKHLAPLNLQLPTMLRNLAEISRGLIDFWPLTIGGLVFAGILSYRYRHHAGFQKYASPLSVNLGVLAMGCMFAVLVPFMTLVESIRLK